MLKFQCTFVDFEFTIEVHSILVKLLAYIYIRPNGVSNVNVMLKAPLFMSIT